MPVDYNAVRDDLKAMMNNPDWDDGSYGPLFIRLAWHSSGTYDPSSSSCPGGSNGATMRFAPESDDPENKGLAHAISLLNPIVKKHPGLSNADLWVLAAYVAIEVTEGPVIPFTPGRIDKPAAASCPHGRLPEAEHGVDTSEDSVDSEGRIKGWENLATHMRAVFSRMGFNDREIVALLSGGHLYGRCHPEHSGYNGAWVEDPTKFSNEYAADLVEDEWMHVKHDTKINGVPIPEETRPAPGKQQYMTKWEPKDSSLKVEAKPNEVIPGFEVGRFKVSVGWLNVRKDFAVDSYVISQPQRDEIFNVISVKRLEFGIRGQIDVGGWLSIMSSDGEDTMLERIGDLDLKSMSGKHRLLQNEDGNASARIFSAPDVSKDVGEKFTDKFAEFSEVVLDNDGRLFGKIADDRFVLMVEENSGGLFERIVKDYNEEERTAVKKLQVRYQMMLPSDMVLLWDAEFCQHLKEYAEDEELLKKEFGEAYKKLTELGFDKASQNGAAENGAVSSKRKKPCTVQ